MTLVCVVLNCGPMFEESKTLLEAGFSSYKIYDLTEGYNLPRTIKVCEGRKSEVEIATKESYFYPLKENELAAVRYEINIQKEVEAPLAKGSEVGEVKIFIDNNLHFSEKIYTMENVRRNSIWQKVKDFVDRW